MSGVKLGRGIIKSVLVGQGKKTTQKKSLSFLLWASVEFAYRLLSLHLCSFFYVDWANRIQQAVSWCHISYQDWSWNSASESHQYHHPKISHDICYAWWNLTLTMNNTAALHHSNIPVNLTKYYKLPRRV